MREHSWFDVKGATGISVTDQLRQIDDTLYVGIAEFSPDFKNGEHPTATDITWDPKTIYNRDTNFEIKGDWSFKFSLDRIDGTLITLNETIENEHVSLSLNSLELTNVSTVLSYKQFASDEIIKSWSSVSPTFNIKDDLGNVYLDGTGGGGQTSDDFKTFTGITSFGTIKEGATKLYIEPIVIASLEYGRGHEEIPLDTIVVDLLAK